MDHYTNFEKLNESIVEYNKFARYMKDKKQHISNMLFESSDSSKHVSERMKLALESKSELLQLVNDIKSISDDLIEKSTIFKTTILPDTKHYQHVTNIIQNIDTYIEKNTMTYHNMLLMINYGILLLENNEDYNKN